MHCVHLFVCFCVCVSVCVTRFRLRKKTWKNPGTVFLDYHVYEEDINISSNWEVFLEVLDGKNKLHMMEDRWNDILLLFFSVNNCTLQTVIGRHLMIR